MWVWLALPVYMQAYIFLIKFLQKKSDYIKKTTKILEEKFGSDIPNSVGGLVSEHG